ncbi:hypothetical protein QJS04_geneDACA012030 [Acorus gramineus]|uniref:Uncharacterized protein n=1 Tax=Acorus gramineus TaxID=55184 RepID=A0AAV9BD82_ACOGR|nr:hypothetical protein QJS04_geneDACA012030 [Acorus gramineus]
MLMLTIHMLEKNFFTFFINASMQQVPGGTIHSERPIAPSVLVITIVIIVLLLVGASVGLFLWWWRSGRGDGQRHLTAPARAEAGEGPEGGADA